MLWAIEVALLVNLHILVSVIMIRFARKSMISVNFDSINTSQHDFLENNKFECKQAFLILLILGNTPLEMESLDLYVSLEIKPEV